MVNVGQPPLALILYVMVYVPAVAPEGLIVPVVVFITNPAAGEMLKVPPVVPVSVTLTGGLGVEGVLVTLQKLPP